MATAAEMAASAAWLAKEHPDWGQQSTSAAQAAQINAAYLANQLPVLPQYAAGGGARYTQAEIADAQAEAAKHMEAFHPEQYYGVSPSALGGMTQEQIASRYGSRMAEHVSSYYTAHPSERYLATTAQYEAQRNRVVSVGAGGEASTYQAGIGWVSTPPDKGTAAAQIAREVGATGGAVDVRLGIKALAEGARPSDVYFATGTYLTRPTFQSEILTTKEGQHFVNQAWAGAPIRANVAASELAAGTFRGSLETGIHTAPGDWGGLYTTEATKAEATPAAPLTIHGEKIVAGLADTNYTVVSNQKQIKDAVTTYVPYGSYTQEELQNTRLAIDRKTGEVAIYQYNPQRDQWSLIGGGGRNALQSGMFSIVKPLTAFVTTQEGVGTYVRPEGAGLSRLGAEATGGAVRPLSEVKALAPNEAFSRYFGTYGKYNLANFVDQVAAGKAEEPEAHIHLTLPSESPAMQYMDRYGLVAGSAITVPGGGERLVGSKMVGGEATITDITGVQASPEGLPAPYISASTGTVAPKGDLFGVMLPFGLSNVVAFFQPGKEVTVQPRVSVLPTTTTLVGTTTTILPEARTLVGTEVTKDAAGNEITTKTYQVAGGTETTKEYLTTGGRTVSTTTFEKSTPSAWDKWLTGAEKTTADVTGLSKLPTPTTEQIKSYAPLYGGFLPPAAAALSFEPTSEYAASFIRGEAVQLQTKPLESAISYGVAYVGGGLWRGAETGMGVARASFAEKAISQGGTWRAAEQFTAGIMPATGKILAGAYVYSVGERATLGGTDFSPAAAERLGGLAVGEVIPGGIGFVHGYRTPENIYTTVKTTVKTTDIAYKAALEAGKGERKFSTVTGTPEPTYKIERLTGEYIPEKLPEASKNALLYGSVMNVKPGITRVVATDIATGEVVGAGAYRVGQISGKPTIFVESLGSVQKGAGSSIVGEMKSIAGREGITTITGESTTAARGFWGKMGAKVSEEPVGRTYPFEITGPKVFDVATGKVAGTLPVGTELTYRGKPTTSLVPEAGWGVTEPTTTGRFDWYVKQPVAQAIARPVSMIRGDYGAFIMGAEAVTPQVVVARPGVADYLLTKASAGRYGPGGQYGPALTPEPVTIKASQKYVPTEYGLEPISTEYGSELARAAYGGKRGAGTYTPAPSPEIPSLGKPVTTLKGGIWTTKYIEPTAEVAITGEVVARAYGKQPTLSEIGTSAASRLSNVMGFGKDYALPAREWYTPAGEALRVEGLNTRELYGTQPVNFRVSAFMQERVAPVARDIRTQLIYPELEIANINRATAVRLGDIFAEAKPAWKSSLNIFAPTPMRYGVAIERAAAEKIPTGAAETKTKTGLSLISRAEEVSVPRMEQMTDVETGITGLPVWPSGPSPVQKQRYVVEEETQYFTLPPGMVSPRERTEVVQTIRQVQEPTVTQRQLQTQRQEAIQSFVTDIIPRQEVRQVGRQVEASRVEYASMLGTSLLLGSRAISATSSRDMWVGITGITKQEIVTTPTTRQEIKQTQEQKQQQEQKQWVDRITEITKVPPPVVPGGFDLRSAAAGGGGGIGGGFKFTDIMRVKSAREVMFGKTPSKRRKTFKLI